MCAQVAEGEATRGAGDGAVHNAFGVLLAGEDLFALLWLAWTAFLYAQQSIFKKERKMGKVIIYLFIFRQMTRKGVAKKKK